MEACRSAVLGKEEDRSLEATGRVSNRVAMIRGCVIEIEILMKSNEGAWSFPHTNAPGMATTSEPTFAKAH